MARRLALLTLPSTSRRLISLGLPAWQNTAEYLAALLAEHGLVLMGLAGTPTLHRGDSSTAQRWTRCGTVNSLAATKVGFLWGLHSALFHTHVCGTFHISSAQNKRADLLSRHKSWQEVLDADRELFGGLLDPATQHFPMSIDGLLSLSSPRTPMDTDELFHGFISESLMFFEREVPHKA